MTYDWTWVDSSDKMNKAQSALAQVQEISVDTEYDSFRYFREKLCLLQIRAGQDTYLFDPLCGMDMSPLGRIFSDSGILKILHAGDNDIRILKRDYGFSFTHLFDTSRAASILGCRYLSLAALIHQYLGIEFEKQKKLQRSKWEIRPLTQEQITYAVRDTALLVPLCETLSRELEAKDLMDEARKAFVDITQVVWQEKTYDSRGCYRIPGYSDLSPDEQLRLKKLCRWRFNKAEESNRAVFMILSDTELLTLTQVTADSPTRLISEGAMSPDKVSRYGRELLEILSP
jgi:ribonuclease D